MYFRRLEDLRTDHDKTQIEIAEYLNMNRNVYWRYEKGVREIPAWAVLKLADYYKVSTDYLLGRTDDPTPPKGKSESLPRSRALSPWVFSWRNTCCRSVGCSPAERLFSCWLSAGCSCGTTGDDDCCW